MVSTVRLEDVTARLEDLFGKAGVKEDVRGVVDGVKVSLVDDFGLQIVYVNGKLNDSSSMDVVKETLGYIASQKYTDGSWPGAKVISPHYSSGA